MPEGSATQDSNLALSLFRSSHHRGANREYLKAWDVQTGELKGTLAGHTGGVWTLAAGDGVLYSGSDDGSIKAWDAATLACTRTIPAHEGRVRALHIAEGVLYSGGHDSKARLAIIRTQCRGHTVMSCCKHDFLGRCLPGISLHGKRKRASRLRVDGLRPF